MVDIMDNKQAEQYLTTLAEMEQNWQTAVDKALSVREDQLSTAKQVITSVRAQVRQLETQLAARDEEVEALKRSLKETQGYLESTREDMATLLISSQKQLEDLNLEHKKQLEAKDQEINGLRIRQKLAIQEMAKGARETLQELETQLEAAKSTETEAQKRLAEAQETARGQKKKLQEWDRVSEKMCHELDDVKGKLKSSKYANGKLREEVTLWKMYAEKVEEERKNIIKDTELQKKVLQNLSNVDSFLKSEKQQRNIMLNTMNRFGLDLINELKEQRSIQESNQKKVDSMFAGTQTESPDEWEEKNETINILRKKTFILEEALRKKENELENLFAQNSTLRDVILKMKKERENLEREKEQMDEEVRVSKLEESVRLIKNNLINDQKDVCVWSALQGVKKEVSDLKTKRFTTLG